MATPQANKKNSKSCAPEERSAQLIDFVETLVASGESSESSESDEPSASEYFPKNAAKTDDVAVIVELKLEQFMVSLDAKLNAFLAQINQARPDRVAPLADGGSEKTDSNGFQIAAVAEASGQVDQVANAGSCPWSTVNDADDENEPQSDWDRRKSEMLAEYGMNQDEIASHTTARTKKRATAATGDSDQAQTASDNRQPPRLGDSEEGPALEALHDSIANLDQIDAAEIEKLKEQLTSKLRDAEVEMSINRAKLSQQWATLEQKQSEVAQRESSLHSKYGNLTEATKKAGLLDRFSRHLSGRNGGSKS